MYQRSMPASLILTLLLSVTAAFAQLPVEPAVLQNPVPGQVYAFGTSAGDPRMPAFYGAMVQGRDGDLYGTTPSGGIAGEGTVFRIGTDGVLTVIHSFLFNSGPFNCITGLTLGIDGNFYGTCLAGFDSQGHVYPGSIFKITPAGVFSELHQFSTSGPEGWQTPAPPVLARDGNFYGATNLGSTFGNGAIYNFTPNGVFTMLHAFTSSEAMNQFSALIQGSDGSLYGTAPHGGVNNVGTVFRVTTTGTLTVLHNFATTEGNQPLAGLTQGTDGNFYGVTSAGANNGFGSVFKITPTGTLTQLHSLTGTDAHSVAVNLTLGTDGNFYGVSYNGGGGSLGSLFVTAPNGDTAWWEFANNSVQFATPASPMVQHTNGILYGDTSHGGISTGGNTNGSVYAVPLGFSPFCNLLPAPGRVGTKVGILGQGFSSASVVKFGGVRATAITRIGTTYINVTVPSGAHTGRVTVSTGATTLTSLRIFKIVPTISDFTPTSGPVGTTVIITGSGLSQATAVKFSTSKATSFTVNSDTQVTATAPAGAITGKISITTPGGVATSPTTFTVN